MSNTTHKKGNLASAEQIIDSMTDVEMESLRTDLVRYTFRFNERAARRVLYVNIKSTYPVIFIFF